MTTITPPPTTPSTPSESPTPSPQPANGAPRRHPAAAAITVVAVVVGSLIIAGTVVTSATRTVGAAAASVNERLTASADGVTQLDLEVSAVSLAVEFSDVDQASLNLVGTRGGWRLERDGDELKVVSPRSSVFGFGFGPGSGGLGWFGDAGSATLTLPRDLEGVDASLSVGAGDITADGIFGDVDGDVSAGSLTVTGEARNLALSVGAGDADVRLADVDDVEFDVSAGTVTGELTGRTPNEVTIDVGAGSLDLALPDGAYDVTSQVSFGEVDNQLPSGGGTRIPVSVNIAAGDVTLTTSD